MYSKLAIAFAVVFGLTSASFAEPLSWHAPPNISNAYAAYASTAYARTAHARNAHASAAYASAAYASAAPTTSSPEDFGRTWDPYGMRWE
jgi:hypothetical protein